MRLRLAADPRPTTKAISLTDMKTCFVVMGFNKKTDYQSGRMLDLDKSYRILIKPTVQECGLECVRADEITHSGVIDVPMYQRLLESDLVIADLSTSNPNALYELGVRHALRPFSTIVIAESKLQYPFNISHTAIRSYQHLGDAIDYEEVLRFRAELKTAIDVVLAKAEKDSPVYTFLPALRPPAMAAGRGGRGVMRSAAAESTPASRPTLVAEADAAMAGDDFATARSLLTAAHEMRAPDRPWTAEDDYVVQRLAHATAMSRTPDPVSALSEAQQLMQILNPATSHDPQTLDLWGETAMALWDETRAPEHLERALLAYERAFHLRPDADTGSTLALLLNVRASISAPADAVADFVLAERIRRRVIDLASKALEETRRPPAGTAPDEADEADEARLVARYRLTAALAEAYLGIGDRAQSDRRRDEAVALAVPQAVKDATAERLSTLAKLTAESPLKFLAV
jgi:hypothetical protein